ncbi:MAG: hypothetical protein PVJ60_03240 [Phycisphaerales bacterium]|jgi:hypothetical protein
MMDNKHYKLSLCFFVVAVLIFTGCAPKIAEPIDVGPRKESAAEALSVLNARSLNAVPLLAKGRCVLQFYDEKNKKRKESLPMVRIVMSPPVELYLQGDATLVPKAIILGSNENEFWLALKPKEISTYWWGKWSEQHSYEGLKISPSSVFEALGIMEMEAEDNWSLSNEDVFDVLTKRERGQVVKKIYVSSYSYLVAMIEYFDLEGQAIAYTELDDYTEVSDGFYVPTSIKIVTYGQSSEESLSITLSILSIGPKEITDGMRNFYFKRPKPQGFKHVWMNEGGEWIEQQQ